jgi:hypothetical protein
MLSSTLAFASRGRLRTQTLVVSRENSLAAILRCMSQIKSPLKSQFSVNFTHEPGIDAGGLKREFYSVLSASLLAEEAADRHHALPLFNAVDVSVPAGGLSWTVGSSSQPVVVPRPDATSHKMLEAYNFLGRALGSALVDEIRLPDIFPAYMWAALVQHAGTGTGHGAPSSPSHVGREPRGSHFGAALRPPALAALYPTEVSRAAFVLSAPPAVLKAAHIGVKPDEAIHTIVGLVSGDAVRPQLSAMRHGLFWCFSSLKGTAVRAALAASNPLALRALVCAPMRVDRELLARSINSGPLDRAVGTPQIGAWLREILRDPTFKLDPAAFVRAATGAPVMQPGTRITLRSTGVSTRDIVLRTCSETVCINPASATSRESLLAILVAATASHTFSVE